MRCEVTDAEFLTIALAGKPIVFFTDRLKHPGFECDIGGVLANSARDCPELIFVICQAVSQIIDANPIQEHYIGDRRSICETITDWTGAVVVVARF